MNVAQDAHVSKEIGSAFRHLPECAKNICSDMPSISLDS